MDFDKNIATITANIPRYRETLQNEEQTKMALVAPFLMGLGYNPFDPTEVVAEYSADAGTKVGEKVDYALFGDGVLNAIIECKTIDAPLNEGRAAQLRRYFTHTDAKVGILTNGVIYKFFTDAERDNLMDAAPFFVINMESPTDSELKVLRFFHKQGFSLESAMSEAINLYSFAQIKRVMGEQFTNPHNGFVSWLYKEIYPDKRFTASEREAFTPIAKRALGDFVEERIQGRLRSAANIVDSVEEPPEEDAETVTPFTTPEELQTLDLVREICGDLVASDRLFLRDTFSYGGICLDNSRGTVIRVYAFGDHSEGKPQGKNAGDQMLFSVWDGHEGKYDIGEALIPVSSVEELRDYAPAIRKAVAMRMGLE